MIATKNHDNNFDLELEWELDPDYPGRAWPKGTKLSVNGLSMHCYALRTAENADGLQVAAWEEFQTEFEKLQDANGGALCTVRLPGLQGQWCIFLIPHGI